MYDGRVAFAPCFEDYVDVFDPTCGSFSAVVAHHQGNFAYIGAALLSDGRVVFAPFNADYVGVFDPNDDSFSAVVAHYQGKNAYNGAALMNDGRVVFSPADAGYVGVYDPTNDSFVAVAALNQQEESKFQGAVLVENGSVVFAPSRVDYVGLFDPTHDSVSPVRMHNQSYSSYEGAAMMNDGRVVFAPMDAYYVCIFDPTDKSFRAVVEHSENIHAYAGAALMNDGRVVFAPFNADHIGVFEPQGPARSPTSLSKGTVSVPELSYKCGNDNNVFVKLLLRLNGTVARYSDESSAPISYYGISFSVGVYEFNAETLISSTSGTNPDGPVVDSLMACTVGAPLLDVDLEAEEGFFFPLETVELQILVLELRSTSDAANCSKSTSAPIFSTTLPLDESYKEMSTARRIALYGCNYSYDFSNWMRSPTGGKGVKSAQSRRDFHMNDKALIALSVHGALAGIAIITVTSISWYVQPQLQCLVLALHARNKFA